MPDAFDVVVVGGGPGGTAAGAFLAREGFSVLVLERAAYPRPRLCGEFLSPEARGPLARLGVLDRVLAAGAPPVTGALLSDPAGRYATVDFARVAGVGGPGLGVQRMLLDTLLAAHAREVGAEVREEFAVASVTIEGPARLVVRGRPTGAAGGAQGGAAEEVFRARVVVGADGRSSLCAADREEARRRAVPHFGIKAHFGGVEELSGRVEIHVYPGGYGGLVAVSGGVVNGCFLVKAPALKAARGDLDRVLSEVVCANPVMRRRMAGATRVDAWVSTGPLAYLAGRRPLPGTLLVGDAAGFIDPFTGEGMAMALRGAEVAARHVAAAVRAGGVTPELAGAYQAERRSEFRRRLFVARLLRAVATRPRVARVAVPMLARVPALGRLLVGATRTS
ncbi:MAG: FAD-dependent monooxygenase [Planctomycetes bacterium]|nr:FAD-dependent monooxygenase [Planctomycetota bacterium]